MCINYILNNFVIVRYKKILKVILLKSLTDLAVIIKNMKELYRFKKWLDLSFKKKRMIEPNYIKNEIIIIFYK